MTTIDHRTPVTSSTCPRCDYQDAYPAIVTGDNGPEFKLVCAFCGTTRDLHIPHTVIQKVPADAEQASGA